MRCGANGLSSHRTISQFQIQRPPVCCCLRRINDMTAENNNGFDRILRVITTVFLLGTLIATSFTSCNSYRALKQSETDSKYRYLTGVWNDIARESIKYPEFNDKSKTLVFASAYKGAKKVQYDSYVRWIGGLIEDLYFNKYKENKWAFFDPWIDNMLDIHSTWFVDHMHYYDHTTDMYQRLEEIKKKISMHN